MIRSTGWRVRICGTHELHELGGEVGTLNEVLNVDPDGALVVSELDAEGSEEEGYGGKARGRAHMASSGTADQTDSPNTWRVGCGVLGRRGMQAGK